MYADTMTRSMKAAIDETYRRRALQIAHNERNGIVPRGIVRSKTSLTACAPLRKNKRAMPPVANRHYRDSADELLRMVKELEAR